MFLLKARTLPVLATVAAAVTALMVAAPAAPAAGSEAASGRQVSAWSPSMTVGGPNFDNRTIRMVVHSSVNGHGLRIHLSNLRGTTPLTVQTTNVAAQA